MIEALAEWIKRRRILGAPSKPVRSQADVERAAMAAARLLGERVFIDWYQGELDHVVDELLSIKEWRKADARKAWELIQRARVLQDLAIGLQYAVRRGELDRATRERDLRTEQAAS